MRVILLNLLRAFINSYGMSVTIFLLLRVLVGEVWALVAFFNTFAVWLWLPALIALPLALLTRSWWSVAMVIPACLAFVLTYGGQFLARSASANLGDTPITFLSYNLLANGRTPEQSIAIIENSGADVVAIQEYSQKVSEAMESALLALYPYQATHTTAFSTQGQALFSKYPILSDDFWINEWLPVGKLGNQRVVLDVTGRQIVVYNLHPTHPGMQGVAFNPTWRGKEIADYLERFSQETLPLVFLGDFNMPDQSDDYRAVSARYRDSYREIGWGLGWTFRFSFNQPILRLDYVFHDAHFRALEAVVGADSGGSDHHPLRVVLALAPN